MAAPDKGAAPKFNRENTQFFSVAMLEMAAEVPAWVKQARDLVANKQYPDAQKVLEAGLQKTPRQVDALLYLAEAHWEQVHAQEAVNCLKEAIQASPKDSRPYAMLGRYLLLKGLREQAVKFLEQAVTLNPKDAHSRKQLDRTRNLIKRGYQKVEATRMFSGPLPSSGEQPVLATPPTAQPARKTDTSQEDETSTRLPAPSPAQATPAAAATMPKAELDAAVAALLTGNVFSLDTGKAVATQGSQGGMVRFIFGSLAVLVALALGVPGGLLLRKRVAMARAGSPMERGYTLLREDTALSYAAAADTLDRVGAGAAEYEAAQPLLALALATRAVDFGGGTPLREQAERALAAAGDPGSAPHKTPAALLARHLITVGGGEPDKTLEADLKEALAQKPQDAWLHVALGRRAEDAGDDNTALTAYRTAYQKDPSLPLALHSLARAHARVGDSVEARKLLQTLLSIQPRHVSGILLGLLLSAGDGGSAEFFETRARKLMEEGDKDDGAWMAAGMALVLTARDEASQAGTFWERAGTLSVNQPFALWHVARMRLAAGEVDKAADMLARLVEKNDNDLQFHLDFARANAVAALGPKAMERIKAGFKAKSNWPTVRLPLGSVHVRPGAVVPFETGLDPRFFPEAELQGVLEGVKDLPPRVKVSRVKVAGLVARAAAMVQAGNAEAAKDLLSNTMAENKEVKNDADFLHMLARAEAAAKGVGPAEKHARMALEVSPQDPRVRVLLAQIALQRNDAAGALKELANLEAAGVESPTVYILKAQALTAKGKSADAQKALARAAALDPSDMTVTLTMGKAAQAEGRHADALNAFVTAGKTLGPDQLLELAPREPEVAPLLAMAAAHLGATDAALKAVDAMVQKHPKDANVCFAAGAVRQAAGKKDPAIEAFKLFLDLADGGDPRRVDVQGALKELGVETGAPAPAPAPAPKKKKRGR